MGTNYYLAYRTQDDGDVRDGLHICKSLTGFQAHHETPYGPIASWADWKRVLRGDTNLQVRDEYGTYHDVSEFIERVEATAVSDRRRQFDFMQEDFKATRMGQAAPYWADQYWLDSDYFTFTRADFS